MSEEPTTVDAAGEDRIRKIVRLVLRTAKILVGVGILACIPVALKIGPLPLTLFFGVAQPALLVGIGLYVLAVLLDLREHKVL